MLNKNIFQSIYIAVKALEKADGYGIKVYRKPAGITYPLIVVSKIDDRIITPDLQMNMYDDSMLSVQIDIYTKPKVINGIDYTAEDLSDELEQVIDKLMVDRGLVRMGISSTPNIDKALHKATMRYMVRNCGYRN